MEIAISFAERAYRRPGGEAVEERGDHTSIQDSSPAVVASVGTPLCFEAIPRREASEAQAVWIGRTAPEACAVW